MSFSSAGEHRVVLQQYKFGSYQIFCICKILPDTVSLYGKEPENDLNWMTTERWAKLENGLWRLFASLTNWPEDARKINNQMLIDHMQVSLSAAGEQLAAAQTFFQDGELPQDDIGLEIVLRYMSHEDRITTTSTRTVKTKNSEEAKSSDKAISKTVYSSLKKNKKKSKIDEPVGTPPDSFGHKKNPKLGEPKQAMLETHNGSSSKIQKNLKSETSKSDKTHQDKDTELPTRKSSETTKMHRKRERRSISHDSHNAKKASEKEHTPPKRVRSPKRSKSPTTGTSERRSARSLVRPTRFDEFILGDKPKNNQPKNAERKADPSSTKPKDSQATNGNDSKWKCDQLDGAARANALREINEMLEIPKPREVDILLLKDMNEAAVLKTFDLYRPDFDRLFKEREHKYSTTSYRGIDHCHIMDILNEKIHNSMITKLGELYSKKGPHGMLIINGLLPLWIIRLFMDSYKFTQNEAIRHISDQLKYYTYLKAINNEPLCSDLEDWNHE